MPLRRRSLARPQAKKARAEALASLAVRWVRGRRTAARCWVNRWSSCGIRDCSGIRCDTLFERHKCHSCCARRSCPDKRAEDQMHMRSSASGTAEQRISVCPAAFDKCASNWQAVADDPARGVHVYADDWVCPCPLSSSSDWIAMHPQLPDQAIFQSPLSHPGCLIANRNCQQKRGRPIRPKQVWH